MSAVSSPRWYEHAPLLPSEGVREFGPTLVVAPHPDDEVLGCGGAIALLRQAGLPVRVLIVSDGAASHPGSVQYPPPTLGALRQAESLAGLACLGVEVDHVAFLGLPDGAVPDASATDGSLAVDLVRGALRDWPEVQTVLLPWRRDPHGDHRATSSLVTAALNTTPQAVRRLEYPIWSMVHPAPDEVPRAGEAKLFRLDAGAVRAQKRAAILAHRSQTTGMIDDATISECLTDEVLEIFAQPWELFIEAQV
jgi:LmbE family N-acetylglucosaminyl deacetylase